MNSITTPIPNALLLIAGSSQSQVPIAMRGNLIAANLTCIAIGTRPESDGPTTIELLPFPRNSSPSGNEHPLYKGEVQTPEDVLTIWTVEWKPLLKTLVSGKLTTVAILADDPIEPTRIRVFYRN